MNVDEGFQKKRRSGPFLFDSLVMSCIGFLPSLGLGIAGHKWWALVAVVPGLVALASRIRCTYYQLRASSLVFRNGVFSATVEVPFSSVTVLRYEKPRPYWRKACEPLLVETPHKSFKVVAAGSEGTGYPSLRTSDESELPAPMEALVASGQLPPLE